MFGVEGVNWIIMALERHSVIGNSAYRPSSLVNIQRQHVNPRRPSLLCSNPFVWYNKWGRALQPSTFSTQLNGPSLRSLNVHSLARDTARVSAARQIQRGLSEGGQAEGVSAFHNVACKHGGW